jgi:hypothetical protein
MFPFSVEARAKMKMTRGHLEELPCSSSSRTDKENWRGLMSVLGSAAARPAAVRSEKNFMVLVGGEEVTTVETRGRSRELQRSRRDQARLTVSVRTAR